MSLEILTISVLAISDKTIVVWILVEKLVRLIFFNVNYYLSNTISSSFYGYGNTSIFPYRPAMY